MVNIIKNCIEDVGALLTKNESKDITNFRIQSLFFSTLGTLGTLAALGTVSGIFLELGIAAATMTAAGFVVTTISSLLIAAITAIALGILVYDSFIIANNLHEMADKQSKLGDSISGFVGGIWHIVSTAGNEIATEVPFALHDTIVAQEFYQIMHNITKK